MARKRNLTGYLTLGMVAIYAVLGMLGTVDFVVERTRDPGWLATLLHLAIDPPGWSLLLAIAAALVLIQSDRIMNAVKAEMEPGEFSAATVETDHFSLGEHHGGRQKFAAISIQFKFKRMKKLDVVRTTAQCYRYHANRLGKRLGEYEWNVAQPRRYLAGESLSLPIAFIPLGRGHPGVYGDKNLEGYCLTEGTAHFVEIALVFGRRFARKSLQIYLPSDRSTFNPATGLDSGGRFLMFEDGKLPVPEDE